jgi:hypothetical protein
VRSARSPAIELATQPFELPGAHCCAPRPVERLAPNGDIEALAPTQPSTSAGAVAIDAGNAVATEHTPNEFGLGAAGAAPDARSERDTAVIEFITE